MRTRIAIGVAVAALLVCAAIVIAVVRSGGPGPSAPATGFARPMPWAAEPAVEGILDPRTTSLRVGAVTLAVPQPIGAKMQWKHVEDGARQRLEGTGTIGAGRSELTWSVARGNPHTVLDGSVIATASELVEPVESIIELGPGELSYVASSQVRQAIGTEPVELSALEAGPIVWSSASDAVTVWQWSADRVVIAPLEGGGYSLRLLWYDPALHDPGRCAEALAAREVTIDVRATISFGVRPPMSPSRLPEGVASAVVPIFVDALGLEDVRLRDGASGSAEDFAARVRTLALGHSSSEDARYRNGGLAGLGVGGAFVVPSEYAAGSLSELDAELALYGIGLYHETELRPAGCDDLRTALGERTRLLLGASRTFDGKFPNVFAAGQRGGVPGFNGGAPLWSPTALTGRRKDVVTQALSTTYLARLADARGLAMLEIPVVATRNPLVAAAAEAVLEPERNGHWTIHESVARALAEVELLSEDERFDFVELGRFAKYVIGARGVEIDEVGDGKWLVHNAGSEVLEGFTLVVDGVVAPSVDGQPIEHKSRELAEGAPQTWMWWDLSAGATYELDLAGAEHDARGISWGLAR